jgi:hypothetical protein
MATETEIEGLSVISMMSDDENIMDANQTQQKACTAAISLTSWTIWRTVDVEVSYHPNENRIQRRLLMTVLFPNRKSVAKAQPVDVCHRVPKASDISAPAIINNIISCFVPSGDA